MSKDLETLVYTADRPEIAAMLVERLHHLKIPARLGNESAAAGIFAMPEESRTIIVPKEFAKKAKEVLEIRED